MKCEKISWEQVRVGELGRIVTGKTPKTSISENYGGKIPFLTPSDDMQTKYVTATKKTLTDKGLMEVKNCLIPKDSVCVSCIGSDLGKVVITTESTVSNQQINAIIVNQEKFDVSFVYYAMLILGKQLNHISKTSTAVPIVNKTSFSSYTIFCPELKKQKEIAGILSLLDDKIELNNKINANLQQQSQAIFKSWFVDFEPFGGTRPEDWSLICLEDCCSLITRGIAPKYDDTTDQIVLNQKCIRNQQIDLSKARKHRPKKVNEKWLQHGDILINSTGQGTLGRIAQVHFQPQNMTVDSHVTIVRPKHELLVYYLGCLLTGREYEFVKMERGSTGQTELPRESVQKYEVLLPDDAILKRFNDLMRPIFQLLVQNQEESLQLAELRDALLPKLMSGELSLNEEVGS